MKRRWPALAVYVAAGVALCLMGQPAHAAALALL